MDDILDKLAAPFEAFLESVSLSSYFFLPLLSCSFPQFLLPLLLFGEICGQHWAPFESFLVVDENRENFLDFRGFLDSRFSQSPRISILSFLYFSIFVLSHLPSSLSPFLILKQILSKVHLPDRVVCSLLQK